MIKRLFILSMIMVFTCSTTMGQEGKKRIQWWVENHGDYAKTEGKKDKRVAWAFEVFERLKRTADRTQGRDPRLLIIRTPIGIYARALPDGTIIINPRTLDLCYQRENIDKQGGDPRMAFILGHELAHLGGDDFIHGEVAEILDRWDGSRAKQEIVNYFALSKREKSKASKKKELLADKKGAVYAAMAGYDVAGLFRGPGNFLKRWASQTGIGILYDRSPTHPSLANRLKFLEPQLKEVVEKVELFSAGVLLFQMESYHDAASAFREFSKSYPAREVFNNMGACYFYLAMRRILKDYKDDYYRFRLSTTIDYATTAMRFQSRGDKNYLQDEDIAGYITKAIKYFEQAVKLDPLHPATLCNLAAAQILNREYASAMATCGSILKKNREHVRACNNKAVALYYYGMKEDIDMTQKALLLLQEVSKKEPANLEVLYNLASIKEHRNRLAGARECWETYLTASRRLLFPGNDNFYKHIYQKLNRKEPVFPESRNVIPPMPEGIRIGQNLETLKEKWKNTPMNCFKVGGDTDVDTTSMLIDLQVMLKSNVRVIALDKTIELVERQFQNPKSSAHVLKSLGSPLRVVHHTGGHFYIYKGFSFKDIAGKAVSYIWYSKGF